MCWSLQCWPSKQVFAFCFKQKRPGIQQGLLECPVCVWHCYHRVMRQGNLVVKSAGAGHHVLYPCDLGVDCFKRWV